MTRVAPQQRPSHLRKPTEVVRGTDSRQHDQDGQTGDSDADGPPLACRVSALAAYEAGLRGEATCWVSGADGHRHELPVHRWRSDATAADETALRAAASARGPVLDIGCGPGRLVAELARRGTPCLGIDVSAAAVAIARARGAMAQRRDVFARLPGEQRWGAALLVDGNIGIGGDPLVLLRRCAHLLASGGLLIADLSTRHDDIRRFELRLEAVGAFGTIGGSLPWASVGRELAGPLGEAVGLTVRSVGQVADRAVVVWEKASVATTSPLRNVAALPPCA